MEQVCVHRPRHTPPFLSQVFTPPRLLPLPHPLPVPLAPPPAPTPHCLEGCSLRSSPDEKATLFSLTSCRAVNTSLLIRIWRKKRRGGGRERSTVTHRLASWLPGGHVQATAQNSSCASFHPSPAVAWASHQLLLWPRPAWGPCHQPWTVQQRYRTHLSHHPHSPTRSGGADTDPLCEAQDPRNCFHRTGAQKRPEAW